MTTELKTCPNCKKENPNVIGFCAICGVAYCDACASEDRKLCNICYGIVKPDCPDC